MISDDADKKICSAYPTFFRPGPNGTFGFECRTGWLGLIETLCEQVAQVKLPQGTKGIRFVQIKEKFGTLRVYYVGGDTEVAAYVSAAEALSQKVCEECGGPGRLISSGGWMRTRCSNHEADT
ncbi:hypothetical protein [Pseudomonas sp. Pseu.R1]|uniref:hypothetical protein n=1 Tax=Pseudomonas sp. Pseu.R1 TaxID=3379818 RepID=UPI003B94ACE2